MPTTVTKPQAIHLSTLVAVADERYQRHTASVVVRPVFPPAFISTHRFDVTRFIVYVVRILDVVRINFQQDEQ